MDRFESTLEDAGYSFFDWLFLARRETAWFMFQTRLASEQRAEERAKKKEKSQ